MYDVCIKNYSINLFLKIIFINSHIKKKAWIIDDLVSNIKCSFYVDKYKIYMNKMLYLYNMKIFIFIADRILFLFDIYNNIFLLNWWKNNIFFNRTF